MRSRLHPALLAAVAAVAASFALPAAAAPAPVAPPPAPLAAPGFAEPPPATTTVAPELPSPDDTAPAAALPDAPPNPGASTAPAAAPAFTSGAEVFARLRSRLNPKSCDAGSNSARWRSRYAGSPSAFSRRLNSVLPLLDFVSGEVERAGLPAEFVFIPLVESWYQPAAIGPGGPAGMWQMIGTTARNHGIHMREGYDGRLSPVESTRAALSYLKTLKDMFGDWQAIVMAYNAGEGRLQKALRRAGSRVASAADRRPHGLSNITYDYVAKLQALSCLVLQPHRHGLHLPVDTRFQPLVPMLMDPGVGSLAEFARQRGKDPAELMRMNPGFRGGRVVAGVPRLVLAFPGASVSPGPGLRADAADLDLLATSPSAAPEADAEIAEILDLALAELSADGGMPASGMDIAAIAPPAAPVPPPTVPGPTVPPGLALAPAPIAAVIPPPFVATLTANLAPVPADAANPVAVVPHTPRPTVHTVRDGESLLSIASHYHLPIEQLRRANGLDTKAVLKPGQQLKLVP